MAVAIVAALPMAAHAQSSDNSLAGSSPSDGATLGTSPAIMTFTFQQPVGSDEAFTVAVGCGTPAQPQSTGIPLLGDDDVTFTVEVLSPFPKGACTITWLLRDDLDQAIATDLIAFSVSADTPTASSVSTGSTIPTAASGAAASSIGDDVEPVGSTGGSVWLGGVISSYGIMVLFGAVVVISFGWPEGPLYEITQRFTFKMWMLALAGTYLHTAALTSSLTGTSFTASLNPFSFADTFTEGWTGAAAIIRLVAVIACVWVAYRPEAVLDDVSRPLAIAAPTVAVVTLAFGRVSGNLALIGLIVMILHVMAVAIWLGGVIFVGRAVLAGPGDQDLVHAVKAYSRISAPAILVVIISDVAETMRLVGDALFTSSYGRVLILKFLAVGVMLFVAIKARAMVRMRLGRVDQLTRRSAMRLRRVFATEATVGVIVLMFSGWLLAINPPKVSLIPDREYALVVPLADEAAGFSAEVSLDPGAMGLNALEVEVLSAPATIVGLRLEFDPEIGSYGRGTIQNIPLTGTGVARLSAADGLPFDVTGNWTVTLAAVFESGLSAVVSSPLAIVGEDGVVPTTTTTLVIGTSIVPSETTVVETTTTDVTQATTASVVTVD
ncbi:MAG: hypothetical protein CL447_05415 [Acidimicrobiaceae bacterium]|nr:hypothetical protein [Acidimicrobiaceae bacterium]HBU74806.1 hypothetical protein [Acidimicrobiaceae bacterium]